ncbi:MAG: sulfite exporter TauE/SafE family protein [Pseudomonadota bacterium]
MHSVFEAFADLAQDPSLVPALLVISAAGAIRGFAGFGGGMLFIPFGSFLFEPRVAVVAFFLIDSVVTLPLVRRAFQHWDWHTVLPCALGSWLGVGFGAYILATADPLALRWSISAIIIVLVAFMATGWRYRKRPAPLLSVGVGVSSGVLGGVSQVSAPPLVAFWTSGPLPAEVIRANVICFFFFATLGSAVAFALNGIFGAEPIGLALWLAPAYGFALFVGARLFGRANETLFRRAALIMIMVAAVLSMPLLDPVLRG